MRSRSEGVLVDPPEVGVLAWCYAIPRLNKKAAAPPWHRRSVQHFTWKDKDGKPMEATFRVTDALHKVKGQWKIFHSHISVPVDPATGKGDMQSKT